MFLPSGHKKIFIAVHGTLSCSARFRVIAGTVGFEHTTFNQAREIAMKLFYGWLQHPTNHAGTQLTVLRFWVVG